MATPYVHFIRLSDAAMEAMIKFYMHGQNLHLARGFVFEMNATIAGFLALSERVQFGEDKVPVDLINGWKGYRYDSDNNSLILVEEELQGNQEKQPVYKLF